MFSPGARRFRLASHDSFKRTGRFSPVLPIGVIGSCAADVSEPRQVCEEATVRRPLWVPQGSLIALIGRTGRKAALFFQLSTLV